MKKALNPVPKKELPQSDPATVRIEKAKFEVLQAVKKVTIKKVSFKGRTLQCVTIAGFATLCGVQTGTIRKYENREILPKANLRLPSNRGLSDGTPAQGDRLYTLENAKVVAFILRLTFQKGKSIPQESLTEINKSFKKEKESLLA